MEWWNGHPKERDVGRGQHMFTLWSPMGEGSTSRTPIRDLPLHPHLNTYLPTVNKWAQLVLHAAVCFCTSCRLPT